MIASVELVRAGPEDRSTLEHLLQLYAHDFSEILAELPQPDGRFAMEPPDRYWTDPGRHAFLIRADARLAGFALLSRESRIDGDRSVMDVADFFVVRGARRRRVGQSAARLLFESFPGTWEVRVLNANERAVPFWRTSVGALVGPSVIESTWTAPSGRSFLVLRFRMG